MNFLKLSITFAFSIILFINCNKKIVSQVAKVQKIQKLVSLSKSACFGKCPVYTLTIYEDGMLILESKLNIEKLGVYQTSLPVDKLNELNKRLHGINWLNYKSKYMRNIPDLPITTLTYYHHQDSAYSIIESNYSMPNEIEEIQTELNQMVYQKNMILALKDKEVHAKDIIRNELQIDMDSTINFTYLEEIFSQYEFKKTKRLSEYMNFYLFEFNTNKISPIEMLVLAKRVKGIRVVNFNKKLNQRDEF
ncbi:MAG: DUF6438 domain-containing protein [Saprospiraceae bacterium]